MQICFRIIFIRCSWLFRYRFPHLFVHRLLTENGSQNNTNKYYAVEPFRDLQVLKYYELIDGLHFLLSFFLFFKCFIISYSLLCGKYLNTTNQWTLRSGSSGLGPLPEIILVATRLGYGYSWNIFLFIWNFLSSCLALHRFESKQLVNCWTLRFGDSSEPRWGRRHINNANSTRSSIHKSWTSTWGLLAP